MATISKILGLLNPSKTKSFSNTIAEEFKMKLSPELNNPTLETAKEAQ